MIFYKCALHFCCCCCFNWSLFTHLIMIHITGILINRGIITSWGRFYVKDSPARDVDRLLNNSQVHSSGVAVNIYLFSYYGHLLHGYEERLFQRRVRDMVRTFLFNLPLGCVLSIICIHKSCLLQCGLLFFLKKRDIIDCERNLN